MIDPDDAKSFLRELTTISARHGIKISGCGCCGSPRLESVRGSESSGAYACDDGGDNVKWQTPPGVKTARELAEEKQVANPAPPEDTTWTQERPAKNGFYWANPRNYAHQKPRIVLLEDPDDFLIGMWWGPEVP